MPLRALLADWNYLSHMSDDSNSPPPPDDKPVPPPPRWLAQLEAFRDLAGTVPDRELAQRASVSVSVARQYRQRLGLPEVTPPRREPRQSRPPKKARPSAPTPEPGDGPPPEPRARRVRIQRKPPKVKAPPPPPPPKPTVEEKLAPYAHLFGTLSASEIGRRANVPPWAVVEFRKKLTGAEIGEESTVPEAESTPKDLRPAEPAPRPKGKRGPRSPIEPYRHLLGKVPDGQVAALAGVTQSGVVKYRQRHGIAAASGSASEAPAPTARTPASTPAEVLWGWRLTLRVRESEIERFVLAPSAEAACERGSSYGEVVGIARVAEAI
jgi:hypothetical protein